jgi:hypothetical protein
VKHAAGKKSIINRKEFFTMVRRHVLAAAFVLAALPSVSHAHLRNYLDTYGYYTLEEGKYEMEFWNDYVKPAHGDGYFRNQTEGEIGITDRYTLGIYGVFVEGLGFTAAKIENRYRLSQPGEWPVDTAVYLEFKDANDHKDEDEIETKVILSKNIDYWNFTANGIMEFEREIEPNGEDEWEIEPGVALATSYNTGGVVTPGLELLLLENQSRIVPGAYITLAPNMRLNVGLGLGLESKADDYQLKTIFEYEF